MLSWTGLSAICALAGGVGGVCDDARGEGAGAGRDAPGTSGNSITVGEKARC